LIRGISPKVVPVHSVLEPESDEAIMFEEFFTTGLGMPLHPVLADILLEFQV
jgi:hypothetical protein